MRPLLNWIERLTTDQKVRGSTPLGRAFREVAQLGRALGLGPRGRRFKSCLPDHSWGLSSAGRAPALHAGGQRFNPARLHQNCSLKTEQNNEYEMGKHLRVFPVIDSKISIDMKRQ